MHFSLPDMDFSCNFSFKNQYYDYIGGVKIRAGEIMPLGFQQMGSKKIIFEKQYFFGFFSPPSEIANYLLRGHQRRAFFLLQGHQRWATTLLRINYLLFCTLLSLANFDH